MIATLAWLVLALPLLACILLSLPGAEPPKAFTRLLGVGLAVVSFVMTAVIFITMVGRDAADRHEVTTLWTWVQTDTLRIDLALQIDQLSLLMMAVVTGVGSLIIFYSVEYMNHDRDYRRFFAEMNFFLFAMLMLVMAANYFFLIVGWGLVGLASYLLIGFYYDTPSGVAAAKKAFVINVIGDVGMILAAFLIVRELGTLDYGEVFAAAPGKIAVGSGAAEMIAILLFVGAAAKSAQIPLHTWLPDAMEGPTPVSALIHAATMVTAGVYMIVRSNVLYQLAPDASDMVAIIGAATLLMAATIAFVQDDIKRILAWSTVSQIGYMIMGVGLGAYSAGMFHFLTHAFFKALLFLAAGIIIHALAGQQNIDRMGGLKKHLRLAYATTAVGCLAIAAVPPFSGFFSKDEIIADAFAAGTLGKVLGTIGLITGGLTAFYMFRLLFRVFHGPAPEGGYDVPHPHPSGPVMNLPVVLLTIGAALIGLLQIPGLWHPLDNWLEPTLLADPGLHPTNAQIALSMIGGVVVSVIGIGLAWWMFVADPARRLRLATTLTGLRRLLTDQYRFDHVYEAAVIQAGRDLGDGLNRTAEAGGASGIPTGVARLAVLAGRGLRLAESGLVRAYAITMVAGVAILAAIMILVVR
ncbi:MAG TPA: NADH-quinone oxidoreductase subunit L [Miltoncostaeaceae bacterium]|nr:NADH-quinone oxidoreductase subunit L [Miltoncostaeaceae bacterium]